MRTLLTVLLVVLLVALGLTLGAANGIYVKFNYLLAQGEYRFSSLMVFWFLAGFVLAWLMCGVWVLRWRFKNRSLRKQLAKQQSHRSMETPAPVSGSSD